MSSQLLLSVVVPVYNEASGIEKFHRQLLLPEVVKAAGDSYEIIYVNDGSRDATIDILSGLAHSNVHIKVVSLSRNFGKEVATSAGIEFASGEATIIMDGDGQHPPQLLPEFIKRWRDGAQVVVGVRRSNQKEGRIKRWGSTAFYHLINTTVETKFTSGSTDYRLIDRVVRREFVKFTEHNRMTRGLIDWLGFRREHVVFDAPHRLAGRATYTPARLFQLAINSFVSLSLKPLYMLGGVGIAITLLSLIVGITIFIEQFILKDPLRFHFTGAALLGIFVTFLVGLVLISQGILAAYLSHIHTHSQRRPLFVIDPSRSTGIGK